MMICILACARMADFTGFFASTWPFCIGLYVIEVPMLTVSLMGFTSSETCLAWPPLHQGEYQVVFGPQPNFARQEEGSS